MTRRSVWTLVLLATALAVPATGDAGPRTGRAKALAAGSFASPCPYSHRLADDPIVLRGRPGASHSHDFFANRTTNAYSTYDSLRAGGTTCRREEDKAAYWIPTLRWGGQPVSASSLVAYYRAGSRDRSKIRPFPAGLRVIAGDARSAGPQPMHIVRWRCGQARRVQHTSTPSKCAGGEDIRLIIVFPDCWNGRDLDSANHKSHMAYSSGGACPGSHPVAVPILELAIHYPVSDGTRVSLSSGGAQTAHADFFNAWHQPTQERLVRTCINTGVKCHRSL